MRPWPPRISTCTMPRKGRVPEVGGGDPLRYHIVSVQAGSGRFLDRPPAAGDFGGLSHPMHPFAPNAHISSALLRCARAAGEGGSVPHRGRDAVRLIGGVRPAGRLRRHVRQRPSPLHEREPGDGVPPRRPGVRLRNGDEAGGREDTILSGTRGARRRPAEDRAANGGAGTDGGALLDDRVGSDGRACSDRCPRVRVRSAVPCRLALREEGERSAQVIFRRPKVQESPLRHEGEYRRPRRDQGTRVRTMQDGRSRGIRSSSSGSAIRYPE